MARAPGRPSKTSTIGLRYPLQFARKIQLLAKARRQNVSDYVWGMIEDRIGSDARRVARQLRAQALEAKKHAERDDTGEDLIYIGLEYSWRVAQTIRVVALGMGMKVPDYIRDIIEDKVEMDAQTLGKILQGEEE